MVDPAADPAPAEAAQVADQLMAVLAGLRRVTRRRLRATRSDPLRGAQLEVLRGVEDQPGIGVAALARVLHLAGNSVSTLVNQLTAAGLLRREPDPADRRAVRLHLAPAARQRLTDWRRSRAALVGQAMTRLPAADQDRITAALPALRALLADLEPSDEPSDPEPTDPEPTDLGPTDLEPTGEPSDPTPADPEPTPHAARCPEEEP